VAELVDAQVSEACGVTPVGVRLSSRAQKFKPFLSRGLFLWLFQALLILEQPHNTRMCIFFIPLWG
jgi:hypothetical protein